MPNIHTQTTINVQEKASLIWSVADIIRGTFKPHEYGKVILPMTLFKRLNDTLLPTKQAVLAEYESKKKLQVLDGFLTAASGYTFYNISRFTFQNLLNEPDHLEDNFKAFLAGFSDNIQDIIKNFNFENTLDMLMGNTKDENKLFYVLQQFNKPAAYMGADLITTTDMGYIFEELVRKFSESYNEEAGAHFTARDIIYTMTDLLIAEEQDLLKNKGVVKTVYDMTMGTSQMLECMRERLSAIDANAEVALFGQEFNKETYAIAKADMIIKGGNPDNMRFGDTLSNDRFTDYSFDYIISNPPFGVDWKSERAAVEKEHKKGENGRFAPGLPTISDGQMLFTLNGVKKLKDNGKMAIIQNGSPLFTGDAGSGPSEIRRYLLENDWLDTIIQLPNDLFYNTGITTYVWIIAKNKPARRAGKVQLIDASKMFVKRRKSLGYKRVELDETCRDAIVKAYGAFAEREYTLDERVVSSKIFDNADFGFYKITVESPQVDADGKVVKRNGKPVADSAKRDSENVPMRMGVGQGELIEAYFAKEVLPFNPNAWVDEGKTKVGYEIPFTRHFYKYVPPEPSAVIAERISALEAELMSSLNALFRNGDA